MRDELSEIKCGLERERERVRHHGITAFVLLALAVVCGFLIAFGFTCVPLAHGDDGAEFDEQTIPYDDLCQRLSALPDSRFPIYSWPWNERYVLDPTNEKCKRELVRVTGAIGVWLSAPESVWDAVIALDPPAISILVTPYYRGWGPERWLRPPSNDPALIDQSVLDHVSGFRAACVAAAERTSNTQIVMLFDRESWPDTDLVVLKLNLLVAIARDVFPKAQVAFYNYGQSRDGVLISPVSLAVESNFFGCSLYYAPGSQENARRLVGTLEAAGNKPVLPWVSFGARWQLNKGKGRTWCRTCLADLGETWHMGYVLSRNKQIAGVVMWPGPFHVPGWGEAFLAFCEGVHNIRVEAP